MRKIRYTITLECTSDGVPMIDRRAVRGEPLAGGLFALRSEGCQWSVDHVPTGLRAARHVVRGGALTAAEELVGCITDLFLAWSDDPELARLGFDAERAAAVQAVR